ncbi:MAG TPA: SLBB domain-containing protein, partial [Planctomycetota bacterium]|nr:SLBB domain-containing protein [Planctomycetota bacterium]
MVNRFWTFVMLMGASCGGLSGDPPLSADFDPQAKEGTPAADAEAQEILAKYARRFEAGYPVFPGDELRFGVLGQADLSFDVRVPADGSIHYPLIGKVALSGRTLEEIRREIRERLEKDYLVTAHVSVQVREYARKRVYVLGAVARPMEYEVPGAKFATLLQTLAQAGGFAADAAKHGVVIYRPREIGSTDRVAIAVSAVAVQEGRARDPVVLPDDIIFVPSRESVYVLGQVARPGAFVTGADHGLTASQAVTMAGGFTRIANESNIRLIRRAADGSRKTFVLDLARVVGGHPQEDVPLQ